MSWPTWRTGGSGTTGRELGAGLVAVKSFYPETPDDVAHRVRQALKYSDADKLYVNPDCGFGWSPRYMAVAKLDAMAAGARIVREELTK